MEPGNKSSPILAIIISKMAVGTAWAKGQWPPPPIQCAGTMDKQLNSCRSLAMIYIHVYLLPIIVYSCSTTYMCVLTSLNENKIVRIIHVPYVCVCTYHTAFL